jgi:acyl carrier protein
MNGTHEAIREALAQIAPEVDIDTVAPDERFRSAADLDSLDFLSLVERLHVLTGVDIPETDYPLVETMHGLTTYLTARAA